MGLPAEPAGGSISDGRNDVRLDLDKIEKEKDYQVIHHDVLMDKDHHIHTLYRPKKIATIIRKR